MEVLTSHDPKTHILIKGAKLHNLKNIDLAIPRNKLVVITGLSGSGKSSLAFDTLYAEGQRRYVESLSSYARQFLGRLDKPKVDSIKGLAPAIAIEQKVNSTNPRSTVGTSTEIYDYLKLLFARIGKTYSPISNVEVKKHSVGDVVDCVKTFKKGSKLLLLAPVHIPEGRTGLQTLQMLLQQGYARIQYRGEVLRIDKLDKEIQEDFNLVVDRIVVDEGEAFLHRLADAVETTFFEGSGSCIVEDLATGNLSAFNNRFEADGLMFLEPNVHLFSFNNPYGACAKCEGYGDVIGIDESLVIPDTGLSVYENAIFPWRGESMSWYRDQLVNNAYKFDFPIHKPYFQLSQDQKDLIWTGNTYFEGLNDFFSMLEEKSYKIQNRVLLSRYRGKTRCPVCKGGRLRKEADYVKIMGHAITQLINVSVDELAKWFENLILKDYESKVAARLLKEIKSRIEFLRQVGLGYLTLNRQSRTLSGGESQRINLATSLGSSLVGSMYILDEPSIGLHSKDTEQLIGVLKYLRDLGNTVIVVEHDEEIMRAADHLIDIGPLAGTEGGYVVAQGSPKDLDVFTESLTASYLRGVERIKIPEKRRKTKGYIKILGARENNLQNIDVTLPLQTLTVITGVSGSGKSTLIREILYPALYKELGGYGEKPGQFSKLEGSLKAITQVELIDQNPIGRSTRSNPVTYIKTYDDIRSLFASQKLSKMRGFQPKHFSFNLDGGRCDSCKGEGEVTIEMQFMADVHLECETCRGKRFKKEILEVRFAGLNIDDVLNLTIDDAISFFQKNGENKIANRLQPLQDVGLGYVTLGQSSSTLSGGEAQRIKLASFLGKGSNSGSILFIFDEPTTGLHFHDIKKLLSSFDALLEKGHSIIVIEHNLDLIKCADYIIDLGPGGGEQGGRIVCEGTPEQIVNCNDSYTAIYLREKLNQ